MVFVCDLFVSRDDPLVGWRASARAGRLCVLGRGGGWGRGWAPVGPIWAPQCFLCWPFRGGASVVVPCCSCCLCLCFGSAVVLVACFVGFGWLGGRLFGVGGGVRSVCRGCLLWAAVGLCVWLFPFLVLRTGYGI